MVAAFAACIAVALIIVRKLQSAKPSPPGRIGDGARWLTSLGTFIVVSQPGRVLIGGRVAFMFGVVVALCTWALLGLIRTRGQS
jgi:hypothetical protein